jgi:hypothetical protein
MEWVPNENTILVLPTSPTPGNELANIGVGGNAKDSLFLGRNRDMLHVITQLGTQRKIFLAQGTSGWMDR